MQPYYEAKTLKRQVVNGVEIPSLVTQIADGENGGMMLTFAPPPHPCSPFPQPASLGPFYPGAYAMHIRCKARPIVLITRLLEETKSRSALRLFVFPRRALFLSPAVHQ
jgi:hypothetical protein